MTPLDEMNARIDALLVRIEILEADRRWLVDVLRRGGPSNVAAAQEIQDVWRRDSGR